VAVFSERLTGVAYQLGWKVICRLPLPWASWAFAKAAGIAWRRQGPGVQVLEANLRRVLSWKYGTDEVDGKELRTLSRAALLSYARYWLEVFRLSVTPTERLVSGMRFQGPNEATLFANLKAGRGVIIALPPGSSAAGPGSSPRSPNGCDQNRCTRVSCEPGRAWASRSSR
jgi:phosphatidylinositol dimannoside acyltransferase